MLEYQLVSYNHGALQEGLDRLLGSLSPGKGTRHADKVRALDQPNFRLFIVLDTEKPYPENFVGMASIVYVHTLSRVMGEIHDVVVDPAYRGKKIGKKLIEHLILDAAKYAKRSGSEVTVSLTSRASRTEANSLYLAMGFILDAHATDPQLSPHPTNLYRMKISPK